MVSVATFVSSLPWSVYTTLPGKESEWGEGLALLLFGWLGVFYGYFAWLANPALLLAWFFMSSPSSRLAAIGCAVIACALAASFLGVREILINEAGHIGKIVALGAAYWLWLVSTVMAVIASVLGESKDDQSWRIHHAERLGTNAKPPRG
jgi:succinate dehydrogenase/fumarate reductase cytochrome b subunit